MNPSFPGPYAQNFEVSAPSCGNEQALAHYGLRAVKLHREIRPVMADLLRPRPGEDADAFPPENLAGQLACLRLFGRQRAVCGFDDRDRGPEPGEPLSQFDADGTATDDGERGR